MRDRAQRSCPVCKKTVPRGETASWSPFCSSRCRTIDLGRWLSGSYGVDLQSGRLEVIEDDALVEEIEIDRFH